MSKWNPYALKKPCANCPFLKDKTKAIQLHEDRVPGIIESLLDESATGFSCHKTVHHSKTGGDWVENEDGEEVYENSGKEQQCAGALIVLEKMGRPTQLMQIMGRLGVYNPEQLIASYEAVIDYGKKD